MVWLLPDNRQAAEADLILNQWVVDLTLACGVVPDARPTACPPFIELLCDTSGQR